MPTLSGNERLYDQQNRILFNELFNMINADSYGFRQ